MVMGFVAHSQVEVSARLDSNTITLGDQVRLALTASTSQKLPLVFPTLEELSGNDIVAVSQHFDTSDNQITQTTILTSFEEGTHTLKGLQVGVAQNGTVVPFYPAGDSIVLKVLDVAGVDTTSLDIKDIASTMKVPYTFWEIFRWVLLALGIAAIVFLAIYLSRRIKEHKPIIPIPETPPIPAYVQALNNLEHLRTRSLWQQGMIKEYHTELTDVLRTYLEQDFDISSAEMTSDQTLEAFEETLPAEKSLLGDLRHILQTADMVKFAKSEPLPTEHDKSMSLAKNLVNELSKIKQSEQPSPENSSNTSSSTQNTNTNQ